MKWSSIPSLSSIGLTPILVLLNAFLMVNAEAIVPAGRVESFRFLVLSYMVLLTAMRAFIGKPSFTGSFNQGIFWFATGLLGASVIFSTFQNLPSFGVFAITGAMTTLVIQGVTVAFSEEIIFRGQLPQLVGVLPAQAAFGLFHFAAYGGMWSSILIAFVMGIVFYALARFSNSLYLPMGVHLAWNLVILGVV